MPPVLGPGVGVADALVVLAGGHRQCVLPSTITMKLASSPSRNSSMTTRAPAAPKALPASMSVTCLLRPPAQVSATITPLPAQVRRPSPRWARLLAQIGQCRIDSGENRVARRGNVVAMQEFLGEGLGAFQLRRQSCAGRSRAGRGAKWSTMPSTSGTSGPTMVNATRFTLRQGQPALDVVGGDLGTLRTFATRARCRHCPARRSPRSLALD
jgi:hypothetical protein